MRKHTYTVTRDGRVFSHSGWRGHALRELRQSLNASGYPSVRLTTEGRRKRIAVHRLVAEKYIGPKPSPDHEVRHIDGNPMNNNADNLCWGTRKDNADDRERHGRTSRGSAHSDAIRSSSHRFRVKRGADHYQTKRRAGNA